MARRLLIPLLCVLGVACLPRVGEPVDGGHVVLVADAGPDAGCAGPAECASGVCVAGHCAAAFDPCFTVRFTRSPCGSSIDWLEVGLDAGTTTVSFPAGGDNRYSPPCLRVHLGQKVAFQGPFGAHPLEQACGPLAEVIPGVGEGSGPVVVTFVDGLGTFGYYCGNHGNEDGTGMAGAVQVVQ